MKNRLQFIVTLLCVLFCGTLASAQTTYNIYFGDIHSQTWYSDGNADQNQATYTVPVARAITYARDVATNFDFLGVSDHNHNESLNMTLGYWRAGNAEADSVNQDGTFVGMRGQEWGVISNGGHVLVYGTDKLFGWNTGVYDVYVPKYYYGRLFDSVKKYNGFCYLAHPQSTDYKSDPSAANGIFTSPYNASWDSVIMGTAMKNGPAFSTSTNETDPASGNYESRFHDLLRIGYHVAPIGNQDNHNTNFGMSNQQRTGVLATSLTRANILDALRKRRVYASEDHNLQLRFEVGSHQMGEVFNYNGSIPLRVKVVDPDGANLISSIVIRYGVPGSGVAPTTLTSVSNVDSLIYSQSQSIGTTYYYYAYVTETNGRHAWSAPVWITITSGPVPGGFTLSAPANSNTGQPVNGTLTWQSSADATQYDLYLDTNNPPTTLVSANQTDTTYSYSGLSNNTTYRWKVVAKNANGSSDASGSPWSFTTIVASPTSFTLTSPSNGATSQSVSGSLLWQSSTNAVQYDVYLDTNASPTTLVSGNQAGTTYGYGGLLFGTNYYWKVVAKNAAGNVVGTGAPWLFATSGPPPSPFTLNSPPDNATGQPLSGTLLWHPSSLAASYTVYLDGNNPPTTVVASNVTDTVYAYDTLASGSTYYWKITALNGNGSTVASDAPRMFVTLNAPATPSNLFSNNVTTSGLSLNWTDNADNETGYRIYRSTSNVGPFAQVGSDLPANAVNFADTGLSVNERYYYRVTPFNGIGEGNYAQTDLASLALVPGAPVISNPSYSSATVIVNPSSNPAHTEFALRASVDSSSQYIQNNGTLGASPAWQTYAAWGGASGVAVTGLHTCKEYSFSEVARNLDNIQTNGGDPTNQALSCFSISQSASNGWNLLSLPVTLSDRRKSSVFSGSSSDAFFYHGSYVSRETLNYGEGFWLKYNDIQQLDLAGDPRQNDTFAVRPGWNILGSISSPVAVNSLVSQPPGIITSNYFGFDGAYAIADSIRPMRGYWVKSNATGALLVSSNSNQSKTAPRLFSEQLPQEISSITFEDNAGHRQSLFVASKAVEPQAISQYELPPLPPAGSFDVRFASERVIEGLSDFDHKMHRDYPIKLQASMYPVHISWKLCAHASESYTLAFGSESKMLSERGEMSLTKSTQKLTLQIQSGHASGLPSEYSMDQNYPNPFNPSTIIRYQLPMMSRVTLKVYDLLGQEVTTLLNKEVDAGYASVEWHATNVPSGIYYYMLEAVSISDPTRSFRQTREMLLLK